MEHGFGDIRRRAIPQSPVVQGYLHLRVDQLPCLDRELRQVGGEDENGENTKSVTEAGISR